MKIKWLSISAICLMICCFLNACGEKKPTENSAPNTQETQTQEVQTQTVRQNIEETYDAVEMVPVADDAPSEPIEEETYDDGGGFAWYETEYCTYQIYNDLYEINNLLAVGKKDQAQQAIDEKIIKVLDQKVTDLIRRREYFLAQNYVALYQKVLGINGTLYGYGEDYGFLKEYLKQTQINPHNANCSGINIIAQKYHHQIAVAADADADVLSREQSLYKHNEYLLAAGQPVVQSMFSDGYSYQTHIVSNGEVEWYLILNPYTGKTVELPKAYYFYDGVQDLSHDPRGNFN